jgi:Flp pilus assembly protein TadD
VGSGTLESVTKFRSIAIAAVSLAVLSGAFWIWRATRPRVVSVCVLSDYAFRKQHEDWRAVLNARFEAARQYFRGSGVDWDFRDADQPDPTEKLEGGMEERRQKLVRAQCDADVILGVTGMAGAKGDVPPFAHTAIIGGAVNFSQALLTLFGVSEADSRAPEMTRAARTLVSRLRGYDFAKGTEALSGGWGDKVYSALSSVYPAAEAHRVIGMSLAADGLFPAAILHLRERARLDASNAAAHADLATVYAHDFDSTDAIREYRAAVQLAPGGAPNHAALALALANAGLAEDAVDEFREALRLDPQFAAAQAGLAYVLTQQLGRIDEAIAAYGEALRLNPELHAAVDGLERARNLKSKAAAEAVELRRSAQAAPADPIRHVNLGLTEARAGNVDAGIRELRRAVELDRGNALAHEQLAILLYRQGNPSEALQHAEAARRGGYDPPHDIVERLKKTEPRP